MCQEAGKGRPHLLLERLGCMPSPSPQHSRLGPPARCTEGGDCMGARFFLPPQHVREARSAHYVGPGARGAQVGVQVRVASYGASMAEWEAIVLTRHAGVI